jgi:hypothetical protein
MHRRNSNGAGLNEEGSDHPVDSLAAERRDATKET